MRFLSALMLLVCASCVFAQTGAQDAIRVQDYDPPEVASAKSSIERLKSLVEAGAIPRVQLEKAEAALADAGDAAYLRKTLYGVELTDDQCDRMMAAANRRFERRKKAVDEARKLVEDGVASQLSLSTFLEELDSARKECDLAETRARLARQLSQMAQAEEAMAARMAEEASEVPDLADRYDGDGVFTVGTFSRVELEFARHFGKPLPVSAMGETALHRALGFDHRGRVDVAIHPDLPEGRWLLEFLHENHIPYFAFRQAVPGKATGAHIHLGPMSTHFKLGG
ncbi:MAG TPA: hypothetical protein VKJ01_08890 [Candidatus Solibacter sp.]|nr:hypothetical protein [Candidatus Solibacter sp.]